MKSVINNEYTTIIKNSKFICLIYSIQNLEDVKKYLEAAKINFKDATHYCYAYILDGISKESDDGEPSGTAGIPILHVLEKNHLEHVLCIVIRYFGKIKLGAGGLVRAYTNSTTACLKDHIITLKKALIVNITFPYSLSKKIDYILKDNKIISKEFKKEIQYQAIINNNQYEELNNLSIKIDKIKDTYI